MAGVGEPFVLQPHEGNCTVAAAQHCCNHQQHGLECPLHRGNSRRSTTFVQLQPTQIPHPLGADDVTHRRGEGWAEAHAERGELQSIRKM